MLQFCLIAFWWSVIFKTVSVLLVQLWIYNQSVKYPYIRGSRGRGGC